MSKFKEKVFWISKLMIGLLVAIPLGYLFWSVALHTESPIRIKTEIRDPVTKEIECTFYVWIWQLGKIDEIVKERCNGLSIDQAESD